MTIFQSIDGCLEKTIGASGLTEAEYARWLDKAGSGIEVLRGHYRDGTLPSLRVPERTDDIPETEEALERLSQGAGTLVFLGTGGSSLGGQTLAQLGGWYIPGDQPADQVRRPRTRFYDNLDAHTYDRALAGLDLETARFVVVSKSGNTPETMVQFLSALQAVKAAGLGDRIPELFLGVTEPAVAGVNNGIRTVCESHGIPTLEHDPGIGGRFAGLTNVGLLPALARGLDVRALRAGAGEVVQSLLEAASPADHAPAVGAAATIGLVKERGIRAAVMMPYSDRLGRFSAWFVQLWAESLGKDGEGMTTVAALGPVDQHSQLQLYLDGPREHLVTVIRERCEDMGPRIEPELAELAGADYLAGQTVGALVSAEQRAIPDALIEAGRPVRTIDMDVLDERSLGNLLMHYMIETMLAAHLLGVDAFGQPAVEAGKILTRRYLRDMAGAA